MLGGLRSNIKIHFLNYLSLLASRDTSITIHSHHDMEVGLKIPNIPQEKETYDMK